MSRNCVTHHYACDCREEKFKRLEKLEQEIENLRSGKRGACYACEPVGELNVKLERKLELAMKAVEFYSDADNWVYADVGLCQDTILDDASQFMLEHNQLDFIGGKLAREIKQKIKESNNART